MEERIGFVKKLLKKCIKSSLNPYCSGRKNRIVNVSLNVGDKVLVLILIVVEERIGSYKPNSPDKGRKRS